MTNHTKTSLISFFVLEILGSCSDFETKIHNRNMSEPKGVVERREKKSKKSRSPRRPPPDPVGVPTPVPQPEPKVPESHDPPLRSKKSRPSASRPAAPPPKPKTPVKAPPPKKMDTPGSEGGYDDDDFEDYDDDDFEDEEPSPVKKPTPAPTKSEAKSDSRKPAARPTPAPAPKPAAPGKFVKKKSKYGVASGTGGLGKYSSSSSGGGNLTAFNPQAKRIANIKQQIRLSTTSFVAYSASKTSKYEVYVGKVKAGGRVAESGVQFNEGCRGAETQTDDVATAEKECLVRGGEDDTIFVNMLRAVKEKDFKALSKLMPQDEGESSHGPSLRSSYLTPSPPPPHQFSEDRRPGRGHRAIPRPRQQRLREPVRGEHQQVREEEGWQEGQGRRVRLCPLR